MTDFSQLAVLIVDDERIARDILGGMFRALRFGKVVVCSDGFGAVEQMRETEFDLAVVDIALGFEDGLEVALALRRLDRHKTMRVLIVTASRLPQTMISAKRAGADDILLKPFTRDVLRGRLEKLFERRL